MRANLAVSEFARRVLALRGALVEEKPGGVLEAVLPREQVTEFGTDYLRLRFDAAAPAAQGELVTLGSPELEKLGELLGERGRFDERYVQIPYLKKAGFEKAVRDRFTFSGLRARYGGTEPGLVPYLAFNFRFAAMSDERRDGIDRVTVSEATCASLGDLERRISSLILETREAEPGDEPVPGHSFEEVWSKACRVEEKAIVSRLADFRRSMDRRLGRDLRRLEEYFEGLKEVIERRRRLTRDEGEQKLQAVDLEHERKRGDLAMKYAVRVEATLVSARRLLVPSALIRFLLARGRREREIAFVWNPVLKEIEPLSCEACRRETFDPGICSGNHVVCPRCEKACPKCAGAGKK